MSLSLSAFAQPKCPGPLKSDSTFFNSNRQRPQTVTFTCGDDIWTYEYTMEGFLIRASQFRMVRQNEFSREKEKVLHGTQRVYHNNNLSSLVEYNSGVRCGKDLEWSVSGKLIKKVHYTCIDSLGKVFSVLHGKYFERERHSLIKKAEGAYFKGKKHGKWKMYYPNGQLQSVQSFCNGYLCGREILYHANGQVIRRANYRLVNNNGKPGSVLHGKFREYNSVTLLPTTRSSYKNGKLHGKIREYFPNGELRSLIEYRDGLIHGKYRIYYESGAKNIIARAFTDTSNRYNTLLYDGHYLRYADNGVLLLDYHYKKGMLNGRTEERNSRGELIAVANYRNNLKEGQELKYINGTLNELVTWMIVDTGRMRYNVYHGPFERNITGEREKGNYVMNQLHGDYFRYYLSGKPLQFQQFDNGIQSGVSITYDESGDTTAYSEHHIFMVGNARYSYSHGRTFTVTKGEFPSRKEWLFDRNHVVDYRYYFQGKLYAEQRGMLSDPHNTHRLELYYNKDGGVEEMHFRSDNSQLLHLTWYPAGSLKSVFYAMNDSVFSSCHLAYAANGSKVMGQYQGNLPRMISDKEASALLGLFPSAPSVMAAINQSGRQNPLIINYSDGRTLLRMDYRQGKLYGQQYVVNPLADTLFVVSHREGYAEGYFKSESSWRRKITGTYKNGRMYGAWNYYSGYRIPKTENIYDTSSTLLYSSEYNTGNGIRISFKNYRNGEEKYWNSSGSLIQEKLLMDSLKGLYMNRTYYDNGVLRGRGLSNRYGTHGLFEHFYENGNIYVRDSFENGLKKGLSETFYDNGKLHKRGYYKDGAQTGWWENYDESGRQSYFVYNTFTTGLVYETYARLPCSCGDSSVRFSNGNSISQLFKYGEWAGMNNPLRNIADTGLYRKLQYQNLVQGKPGNPRSYSFTLLSPKQLALQNTSSWEAKLVLNPCGVTGYQSLIPLEMKIGDGDARTYDGRINVKQVAMEFYGHWLGFYDSIRNNIINDHEGEPMGLRQYFDCDGIDFSSTEGIKVRNPRYRDFCPSAPIALLKNQAIFFMSEAEMLWEAPPVQAAEKMNKLLLDNQMYPVNQPTARRAFTGLLCHSGKLRLEINGNLEFDIVELMLSNGRIDGVMSLPASLDANNMLIVKTGGSVRKISINELRSGIYSRIGGEVLVAFKNDKAIIYFNRLKDF